MRGARRPSFITPEDWTYLTESCPSFAGLVAAIGWHETNWGAIGAGRSGYILGVGVPTTGDVILAYRGLEKQVGWACRQLAAFFATQPYTLEGLIQFGRQVWRPGYYREGRYVNTGESWARSVWNVRTQIIAHQGVATTAGVRSVVHSA